jgi:hypothetical protein
VCVCVCVCVLCVYICICICICIYVCVCVCVYIYIYIYMHWQFVGEALCCRNVIQMLKPSDDSLGSEEVGKRKGLRGDIFINVRRWFRRRDDPVS